MLLIVAPWTALWEHNYLFLVWPAVKPVMAMTAVRAGITSAGVLTVVGGVLDLYAVFTQPAGSPPTSIEPPQSS